MSRIKLNEYQITAFFMAIVVVTTACSFSVFQDPTATVAPPVTVIVTQIVTQVIPATMEPEITNTPAVSPTPSPTLIPTLAGTYDPYSAPLWYPIENCPASRLHIGDRAYVTIGGGPNGIRFGADVRYDTVIGYAEEGEGMSVLDGPWCYHNWIVWMVKTDGGLEGFTPEGNGEEYWLLPEQ